MDKLTKALEKVLMPISAKISGNKSLQAVAKGFISILTVTLVGSIFYLIGNFPVPAWTNFLTNAGLTNYILIPYNVTIGLLAVYTAFTISYAYVTAEKGDAFSAGIVSLISFFIVTPFVTNENGELLYNFNWLGSKGLFVAIIVAVIVAKICVFIEKKGWTIKMPEGVPPYVGKAFACLAPGFVCSLLFGIVAYVFALTSFGSVHQFIFNYLQIPLYALGGSLIGYLLGQVLIQLLWWFGIHGFNVVGSVMMPIWLGIDAARLAGESSSPFGMSMMTAVGQSTVSVVIVLMFFCKSKQLKQLGKVAAPAAVFNIGEPVVFGVPNVLNPYMFIPTVILVPLVTNLFFYFGFASGIVPPLSGAQVSMQVPVVLYGLVQGNWILALWQLLAIPLAVVLFMPFYKMYDKTLVDREQETESGE